MIVQGIHVTSANVNTVIQMVLEKLQQIESSLTVQLGRCKIHVDQQHLIPLPFLICRGISDIDPSIP